MDEFLILLQAKLDEAKSKGNVNADIEKLQNQLNKLKVQVEIDPKATQKLANDIGKLVNQKIIISNIGINQSSLSKTGEQIGQVISDSTEKVIGNVTSKNIRKYFKVNSSDSRQFQAEMEKLVSGWTNGKGKVTDINIQTRTSYDKDAGKNIERLHQATVTYKNELDEVIKKTIAWRQIGTTTNAKGEEVALRGFVEVAGQYSKAIDTVSAKTDSFAEKQQKTVASAKNALSSIESKLHDPNITKSLAGTDFNANGLNSQLEKVRSAISVLDNASRDTFTQAKIDVDTEITSLNNLISTLKNAEYAATSLRTKGLETTKDVYASKLDVLVTKMKSSGAYTNGFRSGVDNLKNILNVATDTSGLTAFLNGFDKLEAGYKRAEASAKAFNQAQKVGINVSGLQSKITDLQRISPEIDNFKTNINGADVTVQSLYKDLEKVNTQSDLSVIKEKWKAFTDAAKSAGIAVTDVGNSASQSAKESSRLLKELEKSYQNIKNLQIRKSTLDPIADSSKIAKLNEEIAKEKNNYNNAFRSASANGNFDISAWKEIKSAIDSATKSKIEYNNAGKTDYLNGQKNNLSNTLSTLKSSLIENGLYTDELKQKIETLESELVNISNKGDLSAFKANLKSIESKIGTLSQVNKIQLSMETGGYESKVDALVSKTMQWTDVNGNARISTNELSKAFDQLTTASNNYANSPTEAHQKALIASEKELDNQIKTVTNSVKSMNAELAKDSKISSLHNQLADFMGKNGKAVKYFGNDLRDIFNQTGQGAKLTNQELAVLKQRFIDIQNTARNTGKLGKTWFQTLREGMSSFSYWTSSTFLVMKSIQKIKEAVTFSKELNSALVNINYTMDVTASQLENIGSKSIEMAKDLHTSAENVLGAVKLYANAKETADSILAKAQPAIMLSNVTGFSGEESAKYLQTIMNQFDLTQDNLMNISDTIQGISQSMAHDFADGIVQINEGIATSGEIARAAGMELADYASMIGLLVEKTGLGGSQLGNSLKTIITRTTKAGKIMGIDEGEISAAETSLRSIGVEVRKTDGEFNAFNDTMSELAKHWDSLSDVEKSNISFNLAGTRQINVIQTLLRNWDEYEDLVNKANNSTGVTFENQEKYAESLEGKLKELSATTTSIGDNIFKSDDLSVIVSGLTKIAGLFDTITSKTKLLGSIGLGAGLFAGVKNIGKNMRVHGFQIICFMF